MNYDLAKQLKDAGFPIHASVEGRSIECGICGSDKDCIPSLSELIEACGEKFVWLYRDDKDKTKPPVWAARGWIYGAEECFNSQASTPDEAVAHLWLALNQKSS